MSEDNSPGGAEDVSEEELDEIQAGAGQGSEKPGVGRLAGRGKWAAEPGESAPAAENPNS